MSETKLDRSYGLLIARVALIHRTRVSEYLSEHNLYVGQEMLLKCLWNQDGLSQKEIADLMGIQAATATRMVIRMERSGFVERKAEPEDQTGLCVPSTHNVMFVKSNHTSLRLFRCCSPLCRTG